MSSAEDRRESFLGTVQDRIEHTSGAYLVHLMRPMRSTASRRGKQIQTRGIQHYSGRSKDIARRIARHRQGMGARLPREAVEQGIPFWVCRTWADPGMEQRLKDSHAMARWCPVCRLERGIGIRLLGYLEVKDKDGRVIGRGPKLEMDSREEIEAFNKADPETRKRVLARLEAKGGGRGRG